MTVKKKKKSGVERKKKTFKCKARGIKGELRVGILFDDKLKTPGESNIVSHHTRRGKRKCSTY